MPIQNFLLEGADAEAMYYLFRFDNYSQSRL